MKHIISVLLICGAVVLSSVAAAQEQTEKPMSPVSEMRNFREGNENMRQEPPRYREQGSQDQWSQDGGMRQGQPMNQDSGQGMQRQPMNQNSGQGMQRQNFEDSGSRNTNQGERREFRQDMSEKIRQENPELFESMKKLKNLETEARRKGASYQQADDASRVSVKAEVRGILEEAMKLKWEIMETQTSALETKLNFLKTRLSEEKTKSPEILDAYVESMLTGSGQGPQTDPYAK